MLSKLRVEYPSAMYHVMSLRFDGLFLGTILPQISRLFWMAVEFRPLAGRRSCLEISRKTCFNIDFMRALLLLIGLFVSLSVNASALVRYVNINNPSPLPPYTNWTTAATNIQDAVDAANYQGTILVTNGVYRAGARAGYSGG
jgi:hypothetical protein